MPIKVTWKSIVGLLALLLGVIQSLADSHLLPPSVTATLVAVGGLILAVERYADSIDHQTALVASTVPQKPYQPGPQAQPPPGTPITAMTAVTAAQNALRAAQEAMISGQVK